MFWPLHFQMFYWSFYWFDILQLLPVISSKAISHHSSFILISSHTYFQFHPNLRPQIFQISDLPQSFPTLVWWNNPFYLGLVGLGAMYALEIFERLTWYSSVWTQYLFKKNLLGAYFQTIYFERLASRLLFENNSSVTEIPHFEHSKNLAHICVVDVFWKQQFSDRNFSFWTQFLAHMYFQN